MKSITVEQISDEVKLMNILYKEICIINASYFQDHLINANTR